MAGGAVVLDVRTPREYEELGHVPGALLLPVELVASAPAVLPEDGRAVVVVCEHGPGAPAGPSPWLLASVPLVRGRARTLDVACGRGRHALLLASAGFAVRAVDRDAARVASLRALARRLRLPLDAEVVDLERADVDLGREAWDLVLVFAFLHRPLFPALARSLAPGGILLCETFTSGPRDPGCEGLAPTNPDHLLEPGELERLVAPLEVVRRGEGRIGGRPVASVAARKPGGRGGLRATRRAP